MATVATDSGSLTSRIVRAEGLLSIVGRDFYIHPVRGDAAAVCSSTTESREVAAEEVWRLLQYLALVDRYGERGYTGKMRTLLGIIMTAVMFSVRSGGESSGRP